MREHALALRRTRALRAAQDERSDAAACAFGRRHTRQLMPSSRAMRGVGRSMGGVADLLAQLLGVVGRDAREVLDLVQVGLDARHQRDRVCREVGKFKLYEAMVEAEAAIGFAPEGVSQRGFGVEKQRGEAVELRTIRLAAANDAEAFIDQRNHEQPEAREQTAKRREVAQQPGWNAAFVLHGQGVYGRFWPYRF
jgi:hypothetical protein